MTPANIAISTWKAAARRQALASPATVHPGQCLQLGVDRGLDTSVRNQAAALVIWAPKRTCFIYLCDLK